VTARHSMRVAVVEMYQYWLIQF